MAKQLRSCPRTTTRHFVARPSPGHTGPQRVHFHHFNVFNGDAEFFGYCGHFGFWRIARFGLCRLFPDALTDAPSPFCNQLLEWFHLAADGYEPGREDESESVPGAFFPPSLGDQNRQPDCMSCPAFP